MVHFLLEKTCKPPGKPWHIHEMWLCRMTQRDALKALCASFRAESGTAWIAIAAQGQSMRPLMQRAIPFRVFRL